MIFKDIFTPAQTLYPKDIKGLTSLRFFAALAVVVMHFLIEFPIVTSGEGLVGRLYLAVDFFFILSGFILTHTYVASIEAGTFSPYNFYIKRLARIYPVHFVTFLAAALATCATIFFLGVFYDRGDSFACFLRGVLLIHAWGFNNDLCFNGPSWSISAEWFAYLLFPLLVPEILRRGAGLSAILSVILLTALCYLLYISGAKPFTQLTTIGILRIVPEFTLGAALYLIGRKTSLKYASGKSLAAVILAIFLFLVSHVPDAFIVLLFAAVIVIVAEQARNNTPSILNKPLLIYWGEASYSLYMIHLVLWKAMVVPVLMRENDGSKIFDHWFWIAWLIAFLLCFVFASLSYKFIESPARSKIKQYFLKKEQN